MKKFLQEHGLWILAAAALISVVLAVLSFVSSTSSPLVNLAGMAAAPFRSAYTAVADWFNEKQNYFVSVEELKEENAILKRKIAEMEAEVRQAKSIREENERFRKLGGFREQRRDLTDFEAAYITEHSATNWESTLTLNKGTEHGVEVNDCVLNEEGFLVGVVRKVGVNWCQVLTILDTDTSLGAQVFRTKDLGRAEGNFSLMAEGRLKLDFLPEGCRLIGGDLVLTSGLGGYFPPDIVIGSVEEVQVDDSGAAAYAILRPAVDVSQLTEVFIIKSFDVVT